MTTLAAPLSLASTNLEVLLGIGATDETCWHDLRCFEATALPLVMKQWALDKTNAETMQQRYFNLYGARDPETQELHRQCVQAVVQQITDALGQIAASRCAATFWLHPQFWRSSYERDPYHWHYLPYQEHDRNLEYLRRAQSQLLTEVAQVCLEFQPPPDWIARLCQRIITVCQSVRAHHTPDFGECVRYLVAAETAETSPLLDALTMGSYQEAWQHIVQLAGMPAMHDASPDVIERLHVLWYGQGNRLTLTLLLRLYRLQRLDTASFRQVLHTLHGSLHTVNGTLAARQTTDLSCIMRYLPESQLHIYEWGDVPDNIDKSVGVAWDAFMTQVQQLLDGVLWEMLCDFRPESWDTLLQVRHLSGGRYLLRIAEEVQQRGLTMLTPQRYGQKDAPDVLTHLLGVLQQRTSDDSEQLTGLLRQLTSPTLLALLPHTPAYQAQICAALGWPGSYDLIQLLTHIQAQHPAGSSDPTAGALHRHEVLTITDQMDQTQRDALLNALIPCCKDASFLVRAVLGENRTEVRRKFGQRNLLAARAMGLLPLAKPDELLQRYLLLTRYRREANSSNAGKKAYERAAAQAALTSLAYQGGYDNVTRLEWAMEDQLGAEHVQIGRQWEIEGYTLTLVLRQCVPGIEPHNGKRTLKRLPSLVKRDYAYREVQAVLDQARDQAERYRQALLDTMRRGQPLTPEEVGLLRRNPLASALLETLVLIDEAGACGLFRTDDGSLEGLHGERVPITGSVYVAHPYTLEQHGMLADWQSEIVRRELVQPFKQVFRELYLLTPAEQLTGYTSGRLAGRRLKSRQTAAILANLGWVIRGYGDAYKPFYHLGYAAHVATGDYYGYDDEDTGATMGNLEFWPLDARNYKSGNERRIPLSEVPPIIFSEVLRDLDLVTIVAHDSQEHGTSQEVLVRRGELVRATVGSLGLSQAVQVAPPVVHVRGTLATYRVHLATAAVYTEQGQYICIVPEHKQRKAIYLPFAEGGEPITSEIISKVLLLTQDTRITDQTILAQIRPIHSQVA